MVCRVINPTLPFQSKNKHYYSEVIVYNCKQLCTKEGLGYYPRGVTNSVIVAQFCYCQIGRNASLMMIVKFHPKTTFGKFISCFWRKHQFVIAW